MRLNRKPFNPSSLSLPPEENNIHIPMYRYRDVKKFTYKYVCSDVIQIYNSLICFEFVLNFKRKAKKERKY